MRLPHRLIVLALWGALALAACSSPSTAPSTQPTGGTPTTAPAPAGTPTPSRGYY